MIYIVVRGGGASMGYHMAGFDVYGVDKNPQPNYPFRFRQQDVLTLDPKWIRRHFVAVVGSPPCLGYTTLKALHPHIHHERLIPATRDLIDATGLPYIIENVAGARDQLINPVQLCGSSFGLRVRRHRFFEANFDIDGLPLCNHQWQDRYRPYKRHVSKTRGGFAVSGTVAVYGNGQMFDKTGHVTRVESLRLGSIAMGIDWMNLMELNQAIPPIYTYWLGRRLRNYLRSN